MVIASIDIINGKAVQLEQGKKLVIEKDNPLELMDEFLKYGEVAVIDLDAAMRKGSNKDLAKQLLKKGDCRIGGGINSIEAAKEYISFGAKKIIIGSKAFENDKINKDFLGELVNAVTKFRIIIAVDAYDGEIVTKGWKHHTGLKLMDVISDLEPFCSEFLFTCVEREGLMKGVNLPLVKELKLKTKNKITAAGGVSSIDEIEELSKIGVDAQIGMSLYTGKVSLKECFVKCLNWKTNLLPVIVQDNSGRVLMLAYTNKQSLSKTLDIEKMCYYSRSRSKLWIKGETSGNFQKLLKVRTDCDCDTVLATVIQQNAACHTESYSCFSDKRFNLDDLYEVIKNRFENPDPESYTATLDKTKVREKLMEEAAEVIEAEEYNHIVWEAADLIYFLTVLLQKEGVPFEDVLAELYRRRIK